MAGLLVLSGGLFISRGCPDCSNEIAATDDPAGPTSSSTTPPNAEPETVAPLAAFDDSTSTELPGIQPLTDDETSVLISGAGDQYEDGDVVNGGDVITYSEAIGVVPDEPTPTEPETPEENPEEQPTETTEEEEQPADTTTTTQAPTAPDAPATPSGVSANGSKIYVDPKNGNDSNDGSSESKARKSLQPVLRHLQAGQTALLMSGEYQTPMRNGVHFFIVNHGTADNWIKVAAAPGHNPVIIGTAGTALFVKGSYVEVSGLEFKGVGFNKDNSNGLGFVASETHHVRLLNSRVHGFPVSGVGSSYSSNIHVINNTIYENAFWSSLNGSGISFYHQTDRGQGPDAGGYNDVIKGNRIFRNENKVPSQWQNYTKITDGNGIIVDENIDTGYSGRTLVANNLVFDNGGRGIIAWKSNHVDIMFNTTYQNGRTGTLIGGGTELAVGRSSDIKLFSNLAWARSGIPSLVITETSNIETRTNVLVSDTSPRGNLSDSDKVTNDNPGLRNPTTNTNEADFRPTGDSFLNNMASTHGAAPSDKVGTDRGGSAEPGAFEANASSGR